MRLRDTTGVAPVRRMTVARGTLTLPPQYNVGADDVAAARAAALAAAKDSTRMLPTGTVIQVTDAFCDVAVQQGSGGTSVLATVTLQGYAREALDSAALLAVAAALVSLRDALCVLEVESVLERIEVVQSIVA